MYAFFRLEEDHSPELLASALVVVADYSGGPVVGTPEIIKQGDGELLYRVAVSDA